MRACRQVGAAIEISCAGLRKPCKEIYPSLEFLKLARSFDVPITLGSDAHVPQDVGRDLDKAIELAKAAGYTEFCRFKKRKKILEPLP